MNTNLDPLNGYSSYVYLMKQHNNIFQQNNINNINNNFSSFEDAYKGVEKKEKFITRMENDRFYVFDKFNTYRENIVDFFRVLFNMPVEKRMFHEVIMTHHAQKIKFDIDMTAERLLKKGETNTDPNIIEILTARANKYIDTIIETINESFMTTYCRIIDNIIVCSSSGFASNKYKFSYHIILDGNAVANNLEARKFTAIVYNNLPEYLREYIDVGVNKSTQNFRLIANHKSNDTRIKKIIKYNNQINTESSDINILLNTVISYTENCYILESIEDKQIETFAANLEYKEDVYRDAAKILEPFLDQHEFIKTKNEFLFYRRIKAGMCDICEREHTSDSAYGILTRKKNKKSDDITVNSVTNKKLKTETPDMGNINIINDFMSSNDNLEPIFVYYGCYRAADMNKVKKSTDKKIPATKYAGVIKLSPEELKEIRKTKLKNIIENTINSGTADNLENIENLNFENINIPNIDIKNVPIEISADIPAVSADADISHLDKFRIKTKFDRLPTEQTNIYSSDKMQPFEDAPTLCVRASMGIGKTKNLIDYISSRYNSELRQEKIIFISFRKTFSANIKERFKNFALYSDLKGEITAPRVIIQVESLHRYVIDKVEHEAPDLLILDEVESIFSQLNSGLAKNKAHDSFEKFVWLLKYSRNVIAMDANISDRSYNILTELRPNFPIYYHYNKYLRNQNNKYYFTYEKLELINKILKSLENKNKIVIPTNSLKFAQFIHKYIKEKFPDLNVQICSSKTSEAEKRQQFEDINTHWSALDVIIYTPTVSAGVSFERIHYNELFAYFVDTSCDVETSMQMIARVRNISTNSYYICFDNYNINKLPETTTAIQKNIYRTRKLLFEGVQNNGSKQRAVLDSMERIPQHYYDEHGEIQFYTDAYFKIWLENKRVSNLSRNNFAARFIMFVKSTGATAAQFDTLDTAENPTTKLEMSEISEQMKTINDDIKKSNIDELLNARVISHDEARRINKEYRDGRGTNETRAEYMRYKLLCNYNMSLTTPITADFIRKYNDESTTAQYKFLHSILQQGNTVHAIEQQLLKIKSAEREEYLSSLTNVDSRQLNTKSRFGILNNSYQILKIIGYDTFFKDIYISAQHLYSAYSPNYKIIAEYLNNLAIIYERNTIGISIFAPPIVEKLPDNINTDDINTENINININTDNSENTELMPKQQLYVETMNKYINREINKIYGITIKTLKNDKKYFNIEQHNLFVYNENPEKIPEKIPENNKSEEIITENNKSEEITTEEIITDIRPNVGAPVYEFEQRFVTFDSQPSFEMPNILPDFNIGDNISNDNISNDNISNNNIDDIFENVNLDELAKLL